MVTIEVTGIGHDLYYSGVVSEKIHSGELCGKKDVVGWREQTLQLKFGEFTPKLLCRYKIYFKYFYSFSIKLASCTDYYTRNWDI